MNIILAKDSEIHGNTLVLSDRRAEHLVKVLHAKIGDTVRVGRIGGAKGTGKIQDIRGRYPFHATLTVSFDADPSPQVPIDLILALPRPIMLKRILSQVTALGVGTIHLLNAARVEKSFWQAGILEPEEYTHHLLQGLEQAVDTILPHIVLHKKFRPFIEDVFPALSEPYDQKLLAHPTGATHLEQSISAPFRRAVLAVGPEGGWVDFEVEQFLRLGFSCCSMGPRILKVDTAVVAFHSRVQMLQEMRCR